MGGGGEYYDRDVTPTKDSTRDGRSYSKTAEKLTSRKKADPAVLPWNRSISSKSKNPVYWLFDDTGSVAGLPKICVDKGPMIVGEVSRNLYLQDGWELGVGAIGDINSDADPIQFGDYCIPRNADEWFQRLHLEGGGGGGVPEESYEIGAYFLLNRCEISEAEDPIVIFTADEFFRETIPAATLGSCFGGQHTATTATEVFEKLLKKFKENVILIRRRYSDPDYNTKIQKQWERVLGKERIVPLENDRAIGDLVVGAIALLSGARTLEQYLSDVGNRPTKLGKVEFEPQSPERIEEISRSLNGLDSYCEKKFGDKRGESFKKISSSGDILPETASKGSKSAPSKKKDSNPKKNSSKPGRLY